MDEGFSCQAIYFLGNRGHHPPLIIELLDEGNEAGAIWNELSARPVLAQATIPGQTQPLNSNILRSLVHDGRTIQSAQGQMSAPQPPFRYQHAASPHSQDGIDHGISQMNLDLTSSQGQMLPPPTPRNGSTQNLHLQKVTQGSGLAPAHGQMLPPSTPRNRNTANSCSQNVAEYGISEGNSSSTSHSSIDGGQVTQFHSNGNFPLQHDSRWVAQNTSNKAVVSGESDVDTQSASTHGLSPTTSGTMSTGASLPELSVTAGQNSFSGVSMNTSAPDTGSGFNTLSPSAMAYQRPINPAYIRKIFDASGKPPTLDEFYRQPDVSGDNPGV